MRKPPQRRRPTPPPAGNWQRVSVQMLPAMQWQLKTRAAQEQTHMREVLHRALAAYLQTPLPPEEC
jgi:hypothetical protein